MPTFISKNLRPRSAASPARLSVTIRRSEHTARSLQVARKLGFRQCKTHAEDIKSSCSSPGFGFNFCLEDKQKRRRRGRSGAMTCFSTKMQHDIGQHMIKMRCNNFRPSAAENLLNCYHTASHFQTSASPPTRSASPGFPETEFRSSSFGRCSGRWETEPKSLRSAPREPYLSDRPGRARSKRANSTMPYIHMSVLCYCTESPIRNRHRTSTGKLYRTCDVLVP